MLLLSSRCERLVVDSYDEDLSVQYSRRSY